MVANYLAPAFVYAYIWYLVMFFFFLSTFSIYIVEKAASHGQKYFINAYFTMMLLRLFLSIGLAFIFIWKDRGQAIIFASNFIVLYLLFLGFEIYTLLANLRHHSKKDSKSKN